MLTVQIDGKDVQVPLEAVKLPEGHHIITPDSVPAGYMKQEVAESLITSRIHQAKQSVLKDADKDEAVRSKVLEGLGIRIENGKPVGIEQANIDDVKRSIHKEVKSEFDKEYSPVKSQNKVLRSRVLQGELKAAAATAGVKPGLVDFFVKANSDLFDIDPEGRVLMKDGDGFKMDGNGSHINPVSWLDSAKKEATYADFFDNRQQRGMGGTSSSSVSTGSVKSKADLKTTQAKSEFIAAHGSQAYINLP